MRFPATISGLLSHPWLGDQTHWVEGLDPPTEGDPQMPMKTPSRLLIATLAAAAVLALGGCGSSSSSSASGGSGQSTTTGQVHFAKTKFVLHAGLAFGAFHRYIYKPLRAGSFSHPFSHKLTLIKAGLAALFIRHELRLALHDAQSSPTLRKLTAPITALDNRWQNLKAQLTGKPGDQQALTQDNSSVGSIEKQASGAGQPIQEQAPSHI
jgi:hypothetical protein